MTEPDWKPWAALDEADAQLGQAKRELRGAYCAGDAASQNAAEKLQAVINYCDGAIDKIEAPEE
jgi:hypothetical protein